MRKIYVDTENVSDYSALESLGLTSKDEVLLFLSDNSKPLKPDVLVLLSKCKVKVNAIKIKTHGRANELDFRIVSHLAHKFSVKNEYLIFSNDNGYESTVEHFLDEGYNNVSLIKETHISKKTNVKNKKKRTNIVKNIKKPEKIAVPSPEKPQEAINPSAFPNELEIKRIKKTSKNKADFHNILRRLYGEAGRELYQKYKDS
jgi:hypothetical protein